MKVYIKNIEFKYAEVTKKDDRHTKKIAKKLLISYDVFINHQNKITGLKIMNFHNVIDLIKIKKEILMDIKKDLEL